MFFVVKLEYIKNWIFFTVIGSLKEFVSNISGKQKLRSAKKFFYLFKTIASEVNMLSDIVRIITPNFLEKISLLVERIEHALKVNFHQIIVVFFVNSWKRKRHIIWTWDWLCEGVQRSFLRHRFKRVLVRKFLRATKSHLFHYIRNNLNLNILISEKYICLIGVMRYLWGLALSCVLYFSLLWDPVYKAEAHPLFLLSMHYSTGKYLKLAEFSQLLKKHFNNRNYQYVWTVPLKFRAPT